LNKWLFGGYETDIISMIAGPAGSGKTNFTVLVACSQAKKGNKVLFVDTEGGFSSDRVKQIVGADEVDKVLENILIMRATDFNEQKKVFLKILDKIKKEHVALIIVDGMTMLYRLALGDVRKDDDKVKEVNKELARQMRILAEVSQKQAIPIVVTNQVYSEFLSEEDLKKGIKKGTNLVGGDLLKYWSKCIIELENDRGRRKAILKKHRSMPEKELKFEITNKGVRRRGWI
jgi:DNA repair protein RadB